MQNFILRSFTHGAPYIAHRNGKLVHTYMTWHIGTKLSSYLCDIANKNEKLVNTYAI